MLLLMLDKERTVKLTRNKHGQMVGLSGETATFILQYCFRCMKQAEFKLAFKPREISNFEHEWVRLNRKIGLLLSVKKSDIIRDFCKKEGIPIVDIEIEKVLPEDMKGIPR